MVQERWAIAQQVLHKSTQENPLKAPGGATERALNYLQNSLQLSAFLVRHYVRSMGLSDGAPTAGCCWYVWPPRLPPSLEISQQCVLP